MSENKEQKSDWERGKDALEQMLKFVSVTQIENLAVKMQDAKWRNSIVVKTFLNSLK